MTLIYVVLLLIVTVYLILYQYKAKLFGLVQPHLPEQIFEEERSEREFLQKYMTQSEKMRTPFLKNLEKRLPIEGIRRRIIRAGSPMGLPEFLIFKALALLLVPAVSLIIFGNNFPKNIVLVLSLVVGFIIPEAWLNRKIKIRRKNIRRDLPNIIDLLNLCVGAGLDFMLAVNRLIKDLKPCELTRELSEVYRETQMGKTRREALKNFSWRVDMPEVHSFVRTLLQADRMGTPLAEALNMQAEEIRTRRFQHGEAMALKSPIKLLFPLFAFILPVVMIIVGGPIILQFLRGGFSIGF
jgi:tight adherence protein C